MGKYLAKLIAAAEAEERRRSAMERAAKAQLAPFSIAAFCGDHSKQRAFCEDRAHRIHVMCARQSGKSQGDDAILLDSGLDRPNSTNLILGFNGPHIRNNNWVPIWKRLWDRFGGLSPDWHHETTMVTTFPNGARVLFGGTDDTKHIKNLLGGRIEDGVVIVDESQDQPVLDELLDSILPPMMGLNARLILSGVIPDVPAGRFWRESGWVLDERSGRYVQSGVRGWSRHNWGRLANTHTPDARAVLDRYLADTGLTEDDPQIQRDWFGVPAFDPAATAYRYLRERNGYHAEMPDWIAPIYDTGRDVARDRELLYAHPMREDKRDGARYGMMAAKPHEGVRIFSFAIDPGSTSDRCAIEGVGWGTKTHKAQHVFEWSTPRGMQLTTGQIFAVAGLVQSVFSSLGGIIEWRYDAGSSQNTIDNLLNDYGIPLVLAAKKTDLLGQVTRNNDLLTQSRLDVMAGSALEQDYQRARWDKNALEHGQRKWASSWHPDPSEAMRYAIDPYFDAYRKPPEVTVFDNPALKALMQPNPDAPDYR